MMENNEKTELNNEIITETNENTATEETPKKKSIKPVLIFGGLAIIALVIVFLIFKGINNSDILNNDGVPSEPEEIQVGLTDYSATDAELSELKELNAVLDDYVNAHYDDMGIASSYGFLYSTTAKNNIMLKDIMSEGLFKASENVAANTDILYLKASDVGLNGNDFKVCTAFNTKDGYYFSSKDLDGKYYSQQEYHDLVLKYSFIHGTIVNPKKGDNNYQKITGAAAINDNYDIKHLACDDKYAVVVANNVKNTSEFIETVLVKDGDNWKVGIGNIANAKNAKQTVNKMFPDMEFGLLPIYNIGDYQAILSDMPEFTKQLIDLGVITEADSKNMYTCSAGNFAYFQTESGKKLLGHMENGKLEFNEMQSLEQTISAMVQAEQDPPVFIIKFN